LKLRIALIAICTGVPVGTLGILAGPAAVPPGHRPLSEADTALHAVVSHLTTPDGTTHDLSDTELVMGGKALADIAAGASWLVREITGELLSGA
jgi:hypothetical protein